MMLRGMKGGVVAGRGGGFPVSERRSHWDVVVVVAAAASVALKHSKMHGTHTHTLTHTRLHLPRASLPIRTGHRKREGE